MENERILELKITEQDLYFLSHIEAIKENTGIFKEKYNKYMWGILKKYNINSIDFLQISKYVRNQKFHLKPELVEKYGPYQLEKSNVGFDYNGMKTYAVIVFAIIIVIVFFKNNSNSHRLILLLIISLVILLSSAIELFKTCLYKSSICSL